MYIYAPVYFQVSFVFYFIFWLIGCDFSCYDFDYWLILIYFFLNYSLMNLVYIVVNYLLDLALLNC